jgi:Ankyrin repeats (3 copies)
MSDDAAWRDALRRIERGDFSWSEPLFNEVPSREGERCRIIQWYEKGYFEHEPKALAEALTCASFLGRTSVAEFLLDKGVDPAAGIGTGLSAFHWAANRGNLDTVKLLIERNAPLEQRNMYGGTVLGCTTWSVINEPRSDHLAIIEALLAAGANIDEADYPTGNERVDELLRRYLVA